MKVIASGDSPNTDGIHVQLSRNIMIFNTSVRTGDDCVSIGPGTQNLWIEGMACGPGHGIRLVKTIKLLLNMNYACVHVYDCVWVMWVRKWLQHWEPS